MSILEWWQELVRETIGRARTLAEMNEPFGAAYFIEADEDRGSPPGSPHAVAA